MILCSNEKNKPTHPTKELMSSWETLQQNYRISEEDAVQFLLNKIPFSEDQALSIEAITIQLIEGVRAQKSKAVSIEAFLQTHQLSSQEGLAMMCLAEALLRIPDTKTKTKFIRDKISSSDWSSQEEDNFLAKIANLGLLTTSKVLNWGANSKSLFSVIPSLIRRFGEPLIRQIMTQAMKIMGHQFVMGETIEKALKRASEDEKKGYRHSFDMLGEGARTQHDANRYFDAYLKAVIAIGETAQKKPSVFEMPSLSVKLSALHPRYEIAKKERVLKELTPKVLELAQKAKEFNVGLTIDAEESERLMLSLEIIQEVFAHPDLKDWCGLGLAVQAYQKRAPYVIDWLVNLAKHHNRRINIRLVKGAYWDSEIKRTQEQGLKNYPVYTQKVYTDVSYLRCAAKMLESPTWIYPQFATHNAYTLSAVYEMAKVKGITDYEFQRLHGMGESLYHQITENTEYGIPCRVYAPVGEHRDLLSYLVRRLLENGANSSFVNQIHDTKRPINLLTANPFKEAEKLNGKPHPSIPLPKALLLPQRINSDGVDLSDEILLENLDQELARLPQTLQDIPLTSESALYHAVEIGSSHFEKWSKTSPEERAECLDHLGNIIQHHMVQFIHLLVLEGKKTVNDAVSEVREAIDFCYYYAQQVRLYQGQPLVLPGPTGELNQLSYHGRGVFACISPWNFPLAIFIGQVAAALGAGNCVIAKPAAPTPHVAQLVVNLAYKVGIPKGALQLLITSGSQFSDIIIKDNRIAGVAFTGSNDTAHSINLTLAERKGPIVPFIAETGGINAMIVDSSALSEQVVKDVITSAFQSAGQRCSALRLLLVQNDVADSLLDMLKGAMEELTVGNSALLSTDVGPVIDRNAKQGLLEYLDELEQSPAQARLLYKCELPESLNEENFIAPQVWQLSSVRDLPQEVFGPILHIVRYKGEYLDQVIEDINSLGYGLTMGVHSRLESTIQQVCARAKVGNLYVNRNMIGAVVGVQPFGGEGLSGTGPKAGGPNYLLRFMSERTFTQDITAAGGNASLLAIV
ncbi:MAG: L-glutamate gamma-semialdehyde dehydrogenase [Alphaproteobacteria bacterium]|nr:L-glutamate gamma-semialdehyde dehydrogenase [Alphaproteobacteria bacterium]